MSRFYVKGFVIKEPTIRTFKNDAKSITVSVEERLDRVLTYHNIEFNGKASDLIPTDQPLLGAEIFCTGTLIGKRKDENSLVFENLKGDSFCVIGFPTNEQNE